MVRLSVWQTVWLSLLVVVAGPAKGRGEAAEIPLIPGLKVVLAVNSGHDRPDPSSGGGILQGDYEMVIAFKSVTESEIVHTAAFDGVDEANIPRQFTITRSVPASDLTNARLQIFGFHSVDPATIPETTALGPSIAVTTDLLENGATEYAFRPYARMETISGKLTRSSESPVKFPVLLNGRRVYLDAIHATGTMRLGSASRPFETVILDHPRYPLSLRISHGPRDGGFPFEPEFLREIVRIDFPEESLAQALEKECRAELRGIYFDFNQATLRPESRSALEEIAAAVRAIDRSFSVEGHTDNVGSDAFNDTLSAKRAHAVKEALVSQFGVDPKRLATRGHGEKKPLETNHTLAGRARNRRVELLCVQ